MADKNFTLKIVSPTKSVGPIVCDSVKLVITDGKKKKEGGLYGIKRGHGDALLSLSEGTIHASLDNKIVLSLKSSYGFATVNRDAVSVVVRQIVE